MKDLNINCVRLPFGYWVLDMPDLYRKPAGPYEGERAWIRRARYYDGPAEEHITRVLDDCREVGLAVILCLHGAPGGQSGHQACGFDDEDWEPDMWDVPESVRCVEHIATTWGQHPATYGITVLNEPSCDIPIHTLADYYVRSYEAVRKHAPGAHVTFPVYQRLWDEFAEADFPPPHFDSNVSYDAHLYQCFGDVWTEKLGIEGTLECARTGAGHYPSLDDLPPHVSSIVSEFSVKLPSWDPEQNSDQDDIA